VLKKLITHSFLYSLAPQVPKIASLFLMPILTKHLKPVDYGIYGVITSYLFFVTTLRDLGFGTVFVNTFYRYPQRWKFVWRLLHGHLLYWGIFYVLLLIGTLFIAIPAEAKQNFTLITLLTIIPAVLFDNTNMIGSYYYRFSQKPVFIAIVSIVTAISSILITFYCVVNLQLGYLSWFIASFASALIMFLFYVYPLYVKLKLWPILRFRKKFIMPHLRVALPMIPHNYSSFLLNSSDRIVMDLYKLDIKKIGIYNISYQFGNYFEAFGEAVGMAVGPFFSKLYSAKNEKAILDARRLTFFLMSFFLIATFLVAIWLKEIFQILVRNDELKSGYAIGVILVMGYAYRPMYWSAGIKLSIYEDTAMLWRISFVAGLLNVILNVIFVPFFGIFAAAIITLLSLMYIGFSAYSFKRYQRLGGPDHYPVYWLASILLLTIVAYFLKDAAIWIKAAITLIVLCLGFYMFRKYYDVIKAIEI